MIKTLKNLLKQDKEKYSVPRKVQDVIPIRRMWSDGIFQVGSKFSKSYKFADINYQVASLEDPDKKMKRLVVMIDEYSDLIQAAEMNGTRKDFEKNLLMLLQRVRNLGIHLIIATQRPSAQIVTGALKAVIPFRVSFRLPSHTDSQTILDRPGAENLLGKGDMLMVTESDTKRMQGLFVSEAELEKFIETKIKK